MIPKYINDWLKIIEQMNNDNTYKLAWGRAIIECVSKDCYKRKENKAIIYFDDISLCMLKYYWNQIFFFKLKQSPYMDKNPTICNDTERLIEKYKSLTGSNLPIWFTDAYETLINEDKNFVDKTIKHISKTLHENVSWRFKKVGKDEINIYEYNKQRGSFIEIDYDNVSLLKDFSIVISKLLNYKWAQLLEKFNFSPKIASKVNGISEAKIKRNSLIKYKEALLKEHSGKAIDFYTGKELDENDISLDHVIPWSFMYSDDIWNLVITSKSNNSQKSNRIPSQDVIERLNERNKKLELILDGKMKADLALANKNSYVEKFYFDCRI